MKNDKLKNIIILLLLVIIIILGVLVGLFATNKISLNSNNNDGINTEVENNEVKEENSDIIGRYQNIIQTAEDFYLTSEFELKSDNIVNYVIGGTISENYNDSSAAMSYSGTYLEKDNKVILSIISTDDNCEATAAKYSCVDIITLLKQSDETLVMEGVSPERTFKKVN